MTTTGNTFRRNAGILFAGSGLSQLIAVLVLPLLIKFYGPEEYGAFAVFVALTVLIGSVSTGRYDAALVLPEKDDDAGSLFLLCLALTVIVGLVTLVLIVIFGEAFASLLNNHDLQPWLLLLPAGIIINGIYLTLDAWANRKAKYRRMAVNRLGMVVLMVSFQIGAGMLDMQGGLIVGSVCSQLVCMAVFLVYILRDDWSTTFSKVGLQDMRRLARHYKSHPTFLIPSHGASSLYVQLPVVFISSVFGSAAAGWYGIAMRLVTLPTQTLANSIGTVYRQKAAEAYRSCGRFLELFKKTLLTTAVLSVLPFVALVAWADNLFLFFLGEPWREAGRIAQVLALSGWVGFFATPVDKGAIIVGRMRYIFGWHVGRLGACFLAFYYCYTTPVELYHLVAILTGVGIFFYLLDVYFEYFFARGSR